MALVEGSCSTEVMSEIVGRSRRAEMRGRRDLEAEEVEETTWVYVDEDKRDWINGETVSGTGWVYCGEVEYRTECTAPSLEKP